jgi:hypothetical protein
VCVHNAVVPVSAFEGFPDDLPVIEIGHAARCTSVAVAAARAPIRIIGFG